MDMDDTTLARIPRCEVCQHVPGVVLSEAYDLWDEGMNDGRYWCVWQRVPDRLLCPRHAHREKAIPRWVRMRGWELRGER